MTAGLYVHIPFCLTRCGYCDFNTYAGLDHLSNAYVDALQREASLWSPQWSNERFVSVFLGGGTPTTLATSEMVRLLDHLRAVFDIEPDSEITTEANPDTVDERSLAALREAGVARVSFGVQSFDPVVLEALERLHSPESARRAYAQARAAGYDNVSLDLIYGANGETLESWCRTLAETVALQPDHLSAYALTIEPATALGRKVAAGLTPPPDPDLQAEMYAAACETLNPAGYHHYEVSNWSLAGRECRHNLGYWEGRPYLGLGAGAHSYRDGRRWWNVRPPQQFLEQVGAERLPVGGEETLTAEETGMERLLLGLRLSSGVPTEWVDAERAAIYAEEGLASVVGGRVALTDRGMFVANEIVLDLSPA